MNDKAITPYNKLRDLVRTDDIQSRFTEVLGTKAKGFLASVLNTVYTIDALRDCEPNSVLVSAMKAAVLDLPIDPNLGFAYLIPYNVNLGDNKKEKRAQFQLGYKGFIQLALRSQRYRILNVTEIYEGEQVRVDRLTGQIVLNGKRAGDKVIGYVSYFKLSDGFEKFLHMTREEIADHAKKYSKSWGKDSSPWTTNFDGMGKKTVLKLLVSKYGPLSIDMKEALDADADDRLTKTFDDFVPPEDIIDTEAEEVEEQGEETVSDEPDFVTWLVTEKLAIDTAMATKMLEACKVSELTFEKLGAWARAYHGWIDQTGASPKQAAILANKGETPK